MKKFVYIASFCLTLCLLAGSSQKAQALTVSNIYLGNATRIYLYRNNLNLLASNSSIYLTAKKGTYISGDVRMSNGLNVSGMWVNANNITFLGGAASVVTPTIDFRQTNSKIYISSDMHLRSDENIYLDSSKNVMVQNGLAVGSGFTLSAGVANFPAGSVSGSAIADGSIDSSKIIGGVGGTLEDGSVTTAKLADGAVTNDKINASAAIDWSKIDKTGSSLADLATVSASDLTSGELDDALLSTNVPLLDATNVFTVSQTFSGGLGGDLVGDVTGNITGGASAALDIASQGNNGISIDAGAGQISFTAGSFLGLPAAAGAVALAPLLDADSTIDPGSVNVTALTLKASSHINAPNILTVKNSAGVPQISFNNSGTSTFAGAITASGGLIGNVTGDVSGNAGTVTNGVYTNGVSVVSTAMVATGAITAPKLQSAGADLGDNDINIDLSNTHSARVTNFTIDGALSVGSFSGNVSGDLTGNVTAATGSSSFNNLNSIGNFSLRDASTTTPNFYNLILHAHSTGALTADRTLTLDVGNQNRSIQLGGDLALVANLTTSGTGALTLNTTGATNINLPTTGTLATLDGSSFTNGTFSGSFTGNLTGNADTVTSGVVTTGLYADPIWISSLTGAKLTDGTVSAIKLQSAGADLGDADVNIDLSNTHSGHVTNLTVDGAIYASGGVIGTGSITLAQGANRTIGIATAVDQNQGYNLSILGSNAKTGQNSSGGDITINAGTGDGAGSNGSLNLGTSNTAAVYIGMAVGTTTFAGNITFNGAQADFQSATEVIMPNRATGDVCDSTLVGRIQYNTTTKHFEGCVEQAGPIYSWVQLDN